MYKLMILFELNASFCRIVFFDQERHIESEDAAPESRAVKVDYIKRSGLVAPTQDRQGGVILFVFVCHKLIMVKGQTVKNRKALYDIVTSIFCPSTLESSDYRNC